MGEQSGEQSTVEPSAAPGESMAGDPSERGSRQDAGSSVIDLRSGADDVSGEGSGDLAGLGAERWARDGSGMLLRMAVAPGQHVDVRLPATFGSDDLIDAGLAGLLDDADVDVDLDWSWPASDEGEPPPMVVQHLAVHALEPSGWPTALARAGDLVAISQPTPVRRRAAVGEVLTIALRDQHAELMANEAGVRAGVADSVHRMRVATRRLRSLLATYRPWLTGSRGDKVRTELAHLAVDLGRARDTDVLHARLAQEIAALPEELVVGPVMARVDRQLRTRGEAALEAIWADLDSDRHQRLLEQLDRLVANPPLSPHARRRGSSILGPRIRDEGRRVRRAHAAYGRAQASARGEVLLHDVRKAAKRARYAAESAEPVLGRSASRMAKRMQRVQHILGENQDSAAARLLIRHLVFQAQVAGENCFTFGLVYGVEMARASEAQASAEPAIRAALSASEDVGRH
jgi:CHAD domain-containing protein